MSSKIQRVCVGLMQTNCYIVDSNDIDGKRFLAVIDPGDSFSQIKASLESEPTHIILTHSHFDHVGALGQLLEAYPNAKLAVGEYESMDIAQIAQVAQNLLGSFYYTRGYDEKYAKIREADIRLKEGDRIGPFTVLHTPGHTQGSICLYSKEDGILISGDTLFRHSCGRTDLGGSDAAMRTSLARLLSLDENTIVYPGHGEETVIGEERDCFFL